MTRIRMNGRFFRTLVSALLLLSMALWAIPVVQAASLTSMTLTLSSSVPDDTGVTHTFDFTKGTSGTIKGIRFQYCDSASGSCTMPTGLVTTGADIDASGTDDEFDSWTEDVATNGTVDVYHATGDSSNASPIIAFDTVTNPSEDSGPTEFYVRITTYDDDPDTGTIVDGPSQVVSAVIPAITVSGTQDAILQLTVAGVSSGTVVDDSGGAAEKQTTGTATATTLPFGAFVPLNIGSPSSRALAHTINVVTNGATGYDASVEGGTNAMDRDGGGGSISYVSDDTVWNEASTEGFGVAADGTQSLTQYDDNTDDVLEYFGVESGDPQIVATYSGPTLAVNTTVVFRVQVDATKPAGDYAGSVNYTVLPKF